MGTLALNAGCVRSRSWRGRAVSGHELTDPCVLAERTLLRPRVRGRRAANCIGAANCIALRKREQLVAMRADCRVEAMAWGPEPSKSVYPWHVMAP